MSNVGFDGVVNRANTSPGGALGAVANANDGWGNAVGGADVVTGDSPTPTDYFLLLETGDFILLETAGKILTEGS